MYLKENVLAKQAREGWQEGQTFFHWLSGCVRKCQDVSGCVRTCQDVSGIVRTCQELSGSVKKAKEFMKVSFYTYRKMFCQPRGFKPTGFKPRGYKPRGFTLRVRGFKPMCEDVCQDVSGCVGMCHDVSGCVRMCQEVSGCVEKAKEVMKVSFYT